ncbi:heterokaryon incompatibility protein-domain-containing protein, partial [Leptodontidium sp. MPI-SDFR-AT-0119]
SYVTLSYCWGDLSSMSTTTKSSLKARLENIAWNDLPKTFQDAISLVRKLKIEYIGIDSLCIVQDDDKDWKQESVKMAEIYSNAYLTIAATCASNASLLGSIHPRRRDLQQLLGVQAHPAVFPSPVHEEIFLRFGFAARFCPSSHGHILFRFQPESGAALWLRAWGFQERALSTRTIHFHDEEMIWECRETLSCECGQLATTGSLNCSTGLPDPLKGWFGVVSTFSNLDITFESDKLPAISGIANVMSKKFKESYIAGIWGSELAQGLLWSKHGHQKSIRVKGTPRCYVPTRTWASVEPVFRRSDGLLSSRVNLHADPCFISPSFESVAPVIKPILVREEPAVQV